MIDPTSITSSFAAVQEILKLTGREGKKELREKLEQAQRSIVEMRVSQLSLMEQVADLKRQLDELQGWESKSKDYQLYSFRQGSSLMARKQDLPPKRPHAITYFCPNCFEDRKVYPVQMTVNPRLGKQPGRLSYNVYQCQKCKLQVDTV